MAGSCSLMVRPISLAVFHLVVNDCSIAIYDENQPFFNPETFHSSQQSHDVHVLCDWKHI